MPADSATLKLIDDALARDETRIGDVFRGKRAGLTNAQVAKTAGATTHGWVTNYNGYIESIRTAKVPDGDNRRQETRRAVESFLDRHRRELNGEARSWLNRVIADLSLAGGNRPEVNDREWVGGADGGSGHFQTIQVDAEVYQLLVDRRSRDDRTLNDTLGRLLSRDSCGL
ncbi:hypothetical protein [Microbacterium flavescens]|uniref:hypothetical protein n=1 Tax=Microbacterium flavescens TaxID=69366 RepID=UPI001BDE3E78|nr:hypothetical protein [Microbacterium flavescens]BFF08918.1 hypothetical protein GCM10025699_02210 [Microbacterium flavescens]